MSYSKKILFFCKNNFLKINIYFKTFNNIGSDYIGNYRCGDIIFFQIIFHYFNIFIFNFKYKVYGCGSAISSISLASLYLLNKFYYQTCFLKNIYISDKLNLPSLKFHCSVLVKEITNFSLSNYKNNYIIFFF